MKLKLTIIATILFVQFSVAQNLKTLKESSQKIYTATITLDYDTLMEYTYPKVFDFVSRDEMKESLVQTFNGNDQMKIKLLNVNPDFKYGEIKKIDNQSFCLVDHNLNMELYLTKKVEEEEIEVLTNLMKEAMETDKIDFNKETNTFSIYKRATMIGIADEFTKNEWKFLNKDNKNGMAKELFSEKVITELGL
jgi:hypothetical protein